MTPAGRYAALVADRAACDRFLESLGFAIIPDGTGWDIQLHWLEHGAPPGHRLCQWCGTVFKRRKNYRYCTDSCARAGGGGMPILPTQASCAYCSSPAVGWDHIIPRSRGGSHSPDNLVPACASCNSQKGSKTADEYRVWLARKNA